MTAAGSRLTHLDSHGSAKMVEVSNKDVTYREAIASCIVHMQPETLSAILDGSGEKGDVIGTARLAGIMGENKTSDIIPLCHPLSVEGVTIEIASTADTAVKITARVAITARTGVEMEALSAVSIAGLTIYDMCKSADKTMTIGPIQLEEKNGGKSGYWKRQSLSTHS
jgi:cyclic pyranopterin phosphate synthase